ncbi:MAG: protein translocase subunit SecD [Clostridiales bacterium]|nr:protein translocase subunit SecD [Clostridiales bacterium]
MNRGVRKFLAFLIIVVIALGWYITIVGIGPVGPIQDRIKLGLDISGGVYVVMEAQTDLRGAELRQLMDQTHTVIERRVNAFGLAEPVVTVEGDRRIRVELPGVENPEEAIEIIGTMAKLEFRLADDTLMLDGSMVRDAGITRDPDRGGFAVSMEFSREGGLAFAEATRIAYNRQVVSAHPGIPANAILIILDNEIVSHPTVTDGPIQGGRAQITGGRGGFSQEEAIQLANFIRGGALPVDLEEVTSSTRTATIGFDALERSIRAGVIGFILLFMLMLVVYRIMGVAANIALALYVILLLWIFVGIGAVLTLPGIAGIILSIAMATDANVIIFSRIREEISAGKTVRTAIQSGFKRAMATIIDSQLTTILAALVLYFAGTSTVRGFALTLMIGIVISIFTAVVVTQLYLIVFGESKLFSAKKFFGVKEDNEPAFKIKKEINFVKNRKIYYIISLIVIVVGLLIGGVRGYNYGIDFTGGTMMQIDMGRHVAEADIQRVAERHDISVEVVYAGAQNEQVIIRTMASLDSAERTRLVNDMTSEFGLTADSVLAMDHFGPAVSRELRTNTILAILIASLGILVYIIIRFEWKFGVATLVGIGHDVLFVIALYAIFGFTINNPFIAGILTVVGYSINDTIVIFDRVRENLGIMRKNKTEEIVDKSANQVLGRSIMTSVSTIVVMLPLMLMTTPAISEFILPLMIGAIVGTLSSLGICSPVYYELTRLTGGSRYKGKKSKKIGKDTDKEIDE